MRREALDIELSPAQRAARGVIAEAAEKLMVLGMSGIIALIPDRPDAQQSLPAIVSHTVCTFGDPCLLPSLAANVAEVVIAGDIEAAR